MNNTSDLLAQSIADESIHLLDQCCVKIRHCLGQLDEQQVWYRTHNSSNSIGNLILHLAGNLQQWAVNGVGQKPDHRKREAEFEADGEFKKSVLIQRLATVVENASYVIRSCTAERWLTELEVQGFRVNAHAAISHTTSHFVGHTHQIIFITRLILGDQYEFQWSPDLDRGKVPV